MKLKFTDKVCVSVTMEEKERKALQDMANKKTDGNKSQYIRKILFPNGVIKEAK